MLNQLKDHDDIQGQPRQSSKSSYQEFVPCDEFPNLTVVDLMENSLLQRPHRLDLRSQYESAEGTFRVYKFKWHCPSILITPIMSIFDWAKINALEKKQLNSLEIMRKRICILIPIPTLNGFSEYREGRQPMPSPVTRKSLLEINEELLAEKYDHRQVAQAVEPQKCNSHSVLDVQESRIQLCMRTFRKNASIWNLLQLLISFD